MVMCVLLPDSGPCAQERGPHRLSDGAETEMSSITHLCNRNRVPCLGSLEKNFQANSLTEA